jgi:hypothetical protein
MTNAFAGFPPETLRFLRQKQFYVSQTEPAELAGQPALFHGLFALFSAMIPLVQFLNLPLQSLAAAASANAFDRQLDW